MQLYRIGDMHFVIDGHHRKEIADRLGAAGIYVRRFAGTPARLRFGLPPDKAAWCRLSRILR